MPTIFQRTTPARGEVVRSRATLLHRPFQFPFQRCRVGCGNKKTLWRSCLVRSCIRATREPKPSPDNLTEAFYRDHLQLRRPLQDIFMKAYSRNPASRAVDNSAAAYG